MKKHWVALLSMLGLAGSGLPVQSQVLKGSDQSKIKGSKTAGNTKVVPQGAEKTNGQSKLQLKQQTLRQQKGTGANGALTPPPPGQAGNNQQLTKGNQQITKGNQQITKGNSQQVTKGNQQITKGNSQQITKGNNQQITKGNNQQITKGNNQQLTKGNQQLTKAGLTKATGAPQ